MSEHIESVNRIAQLYRNSAKKLEGDRRQWNIGVAERLEAASAELSRLYELTSALPPDLGNIYDLPSELQQELSITKTDELDDRLVTVINAYGGTATLDQILVGLYRKFGVSQKRRFLQNKLYRMAMVWSLPGKKGVYTTAEPKPEPTPEPEPEVTVSTATATTSSSFDDDDIPF